MSALTSKRRWARRIAAIVVLLLMIMLWASRRPITRQMGKFLDVSERPIPTDDVMVLTGQPETRPFVAAAILNAGLADRVLICRPWLSPEAEDGLVPKENEIIRRVLKARDVPLSAVHELPGEVTSTFDEARALGNYLDDNPQRTVAVVTNDFHTRRARLIFDEVVGDKSNRIRFVAAPVDGVDKSNWWQSDRGAVLYLSEYGKLAYHLVRY